MKKRTLISIDLIVLGFILECLHFLTEIRFFEIEFSTLGLVSIVLGVVGILWYSIVPVLEKRAETLGKFKKGRVRSNHQT